MELETDWFDVGYDLVERPGGELARYWWVAPDDAVWIVARTHGGEVVLVEQYRPRQRERYLEIPAGRVEDGESYAAAAERELREETGYLAGDLDVLGVYDTGGWLRQKRAVAVATDLATGPPAPDDGEFIDVQTLPVAEALDRIATPPTTVATLAPLLLAAEEGLL